MVDNLPTTAIETLANGAPVVGSQCGGIGEIVRHGETGFWVPPSHIDFLTNVLHTLLTDDLRWSRQAAAARANFLVWFD